MFELSLPGRFHLLQAASARVALCARRACARALRLSVALVGAVVWGLFVPVGRELMLRVVGLVLQVV